MTTFSKYTIEYEQKLVRLAYLMANEQSSSSEAFTLREDLAILDSSLPENEMLLMCGLSSDLYMIENDEILDPPSAQDAASFANDLMGAFNSHNWLRTLELLRINTANLLNEHRAYLRGRVYDELGFKLSALEFYKYASMLNNTDAVYRYLVLYSLITIDRQVAEETAREYLITPETWPAVTILSASVLFQSTQDEDPETNIATYKYLVGILQGILNKSEILPNLPPSVVAMAYLTLGYSLDGLHDYDVAAKALEYALIIDPKNVNVQVVVRVNIAEIQRKARAGIISKSGFVVPDKPLLVGIATTDLPANKDSEIESALAA